jgi:hypothetical protein
MLFAFIDLPKTTDGLRENIAAARMLLYNG